MEFERNTVYDVVEAEFGWTKERKIKIRGVLVGYSSTQETEDNFPVTINDLFGYCYSDVILQNISVLSDEGKFVAINDKHKYYFNYSGLCCNPCKLKLCRTVLVEKRFNKIQSETIKFENDNARKI